MKQTRSLALRSERLAELTFDEMRAVQGGASLRECIDEIRHPSDRFVTVCDCLTNQNCRTLFC